MKLKTSLLAATILSISFNVQARESFYNLRNVEPSISINLGALGNLEPVPQKSGGTIGGGSAPALVAHPVYDYSTPKPVKTQNPKPRPAKKPVVEKAEAAPAEPAKKAEVVKAPAPKPAPVEPAKTAEVTLPKLAEAPAKKPEVELPKLPSPAEPIKKVELPQTPTPKPVEAEPAKKAEVAKIAIPAKPVIDLPPTPVKTVASGSDKSIEAIYNSAPPAPPAAPPAVAPQVAPGPKVVVSAPLEKPKQTAKAEINKDTPAPAIVAEVAKTPLPPTAESAALRKSDKVVSLPQVNEPAKTELKPLVAPQTNPNLPPPPKLVEAKKATSDNINIATPNFVNSEDEPLSDLPPSPKPVKAADVKAKKAETEVEKPHTPKPIVSVSDISAPMPVKAEAPAAAPVKTATPAPAIVAMPLPQPEIKPAPAPVMQQAASAPAPIASENLEKPSVRALPPLSSLYDNKLPAATAAAAPITATMPSKDAVIVQPQQLAQSNPQTPAPANGGSGMTMTYSEAETELPLSEKPKLDSIISQLNASKTSRVAVIAYASGTPDQTAQAKRTALARALAVRSYLLEHNIAADRMDIKPLGNKSESGVPDRVDISIEKTGRS